MEAVKEKIAFYGIKRYIGSMNADELKAARKEMGMTQKSFATFLAVKTRTVVAWENRENPVPDWVPKRLEENRLSIRPNLPIDVIIAAQAAASAKGLTIDEWIACVLRGYLDLDCAKKRNAA